MMIGITTIDSANDFMFYKKAVYFNLWTIRIPLWIAAWNMFLDAPLLGQGPAAFALLSDQYISELSLPSWVVRDGRHMPWVHNLYLEGLADGGLLGLIAVILVCCYLLLIVVNVFLGKTKKKILQYCWIFRQFVCYSYCRCF